MFAKKKVIIIGGGITGLSTAYFLHEKSKEQGVPVDITLIEADNRLGGKITTDRADDFVIEGGPDSFLSAKPWGIALCRKLGLLDRIVQTDPIHKSIYLLSGGRLQSFPEGMNLMIPGRLLPFLSTPLVSWPGKARMGLDLLLPRKTVSFDESIGAFVRRRLGEEAVRTFAEPVLATIYAGDVERLSMRATFPQFMEMEQQFGSLIRGLWIRQQTAKNKTGSDPKKESFTLFVTLQEGLSGLVQSLREKLQEAGTVFRLGQRVEGVRPLRARSSSLEKTGYDIDLSGERISADAVVITTDAGTARGLLAPWEETGIAESLSAIPYASTATVSLGFRREEVAHPLNGFGFVCPRNGRGTLLAATWSSTKFSGRAPASAVLIRSFLGGAHQEEVVNLSDNQLIASVQKELTPILGIRGKPIIARVFKWKKANPQYNVGHLDRVTAIEKGVAHYPGLFLAGAAYRGVGIPDCIEQGQSAAEKTIRFCKLG
jgi:oxygen-dependent protoporphyrinogen oxidase